MSLAGSRTGITGGVCLWDIGGVISPDRGGGNLKGIPPDRII